MKPRFLIPLDLSACSCDTILFEARESTIRFHRAHPAGIAYYIQLSLRLHAIRRTRSLVSRVVAGWRIGRVTLIFLKRALEKPLTIDNHSS
jgi:hypothetical protein